MFQTAYYGHHKCCSQYITKIIKDICDTLKYTWEIEDHAVELPKRLYPDYLPLEKSCLICWNSDYLLVRSLECPGFHVIRDPRDMIVSGYFSHLYNHSERWPKMKVYRNYLKTLDKEKGILAEMEFSSVYLYHIFSWDYHNPNILEKRFEDLIANPVEEFKQIFSHLQITPNLLSQEDLHAIVEKHAFNRLSGGRKEGEEDVYSHYRRGLPGDWKNHFSSHHIEQFKKLFNPILIKTGYETDENW
ncbi:sulfotransferase domain-containing protein [Calothrix sp. CCY 0018]|uniref:sulfotransferase domain-containing protein n=1 Tax=Calothrix sp. CCY 0018 TaxID=3103864 RepID=UPI0039C68806